MTAGNKPGQAGSALFFDISIKHQQKATGRELRLAAAGNLGNENSASMLKDR
jgi:hypothetical protein